MNKSSAATSTQILAQAVLVTPSLLPEPCKMRLKNGLPPRIWIDLDNSPHVPFFAPIIDELEKRGCSVLVTARDGSNVCDLLDLFRINGRIIGHHYGRHKLIKVAATCWRTLQLARIAIAHKPHLAISHGSRSQLLACSLLRLPSIEIFDYEFASLTPFKPLYRTGRHWLIGPEVLSDVGRASYSGRFLPYPGIKEDVYVSQFRPDSGIQTKLGLSPAMLVATVRPPAEDAHYFHPETGRVFSAAMDLLLARPDVKIVLLPRNKKQRLVLTARWHSAFDSGKIVIPDSAVDGLNLIWHSDLVISGGGTMNRESAALGVPVYSVYRGRTGAVDRHLSQIGRLVLIESVEEVRTKILLQSRPKSAQPASTNRDALSHITANVLFVLQSILEFEDALPAQGAGSPVIHSL